MISPLSKTPALPIAIGWIAGVLLWVFGSPWWVMLIIFAFGTGLFFKQLHYIAFGVYSVCAGWIICSFHEPHKAPAGVFDGRERQYSAVITQFSTYDNNQTVIMSIDSIDMNGKITACNSFKIRASMSPDWALFIGERVRIDAVLEPLDQISYFPHDRDSRLYDLRQGVAAQTYLDESSLRRIGIEKTLGWWFYQRREQILHLLAHSDLSEQSYGLVSAITVGYGDALEGTMRENFRAAGIAHMLALSGFHAGIIVMLTSIALFPMRAFYRLRRLRLVITLLLIWLYALMVGLPESVVRTVVMLSVLLTTKILGEESNPYNALCVAVVIILTFSPFSLFSTGFQLSVAAVLGILALSSKLNPFDPKRHLLYRAAMLITVPFAAITGTLAITIVTFHRLPLLFAFSNFTISLLLPLLMFGGIGVIIASALGIKALWLCRLVDRLTELISNIADWIADFSFSELSGIYLTNIQIIVLILMVAVILITANFPKKAIILGGTAVFGICLISMFFTGERFPERESFIVGMSGNTAIVVRDGSKMKAVFTCHPRFIDNAKDKFTKRMESYLESRGIDTIEIIKSNIECPMLSRNGNLLVINGKTIALATQPGKPDSIEGHVDYALVGSRFRGEIDEVERLFHPDTIILSRDLSLRRLNELKRKSTLPTIDMRRTAISLN